MTGAFPPGFLEFFILEASDYVEQLDAVLLGGGAASGFSGANGVGGMPGLSAADAATMQRVARALRGTATMAKLTAYADLAAGIERVGRALQEGTVHWDPALSGALVAAIDDLKSLLHSARTWSATEDQRASARVAELARYVPTVPRTGAGRGESSAIQAPAAAFFGTEAANIAAGLELLTTRAGDPATAANVLARVRALRGVAGVKEIAPLAEVLEATEEATRGLEDPHAGASAGPTELTAQARQLLEAAAAYLRTQSAALRTGAHVDAPSSARDAFEGALEAWSTTMAGAAADRERVVPISQLFFGDETSGIVETSPNPPTSATERFRLELVSLGEHLSQVVAGARQASSGGAPGSVARAGRDLHRALEALEAAARSFGEQQVAEFVAGHAQAADRLDYLSLASLEDLAAVVSEPGDAGERLRARVSDVTGGRHLSSAIGTGFGHGEPVESAPPLMSEINQVPAQRPAPVLSDRPAPVSSERPAPAPLFTPPTGAPPPPPAPPPAAPPPVPTPAMPAAALLDSTIAALESIPEFAFARPTPIPEEALVPIESLLYHGRSALDRAVEIRDDLRRRGAAASPDAAALEELYDLLELARTE